MVWPLRWRIYWELRGSNGFPRVCEWTGCLFRSQRVVNLGDHSLGNPQSGEKENVMILTAFTLFHVALSLVGILSGFVVLAGFLSAKRSNGWTAVFLVTTVLTSVTGFLFPFHKFLPSHAVGIVSLIVLAVAIPALYVFRLAGDRKGVM